MIQTFTIFSLLFLVTALVSFFGAFLAWQRNNVNGAPEVTWLMITSGFAALWVMFETIASSVPEKILWSKLEMTGGLFVPVLYFIFVLRYTGKDKSLSLKYIIWYFVIPLITLGLIFTNEKHYLYWSGFSAISPKTNLIEYYHGPCFWIGYVLYSYILLAIASIILLKFILRHRTSFRAHGLIIFTGSLLPWTASFLYITDINITPGLDLVPTSMTLSGVILIYSILYKRLLDLVPVAREALVEIMPEGILALDNKNRIQDINRKALYYLGISNKKITGVPVASAGATVIPLLEAVLSERESEQVETVSGGILKIYSVAKQPLKTQQGSRLILISDITEHLSRQRKMLVAEENYRKFYTMFRLMADNMPDMLWAKDLDKKFIFTNKAVCENLLMTEDTNEPQGKAFSYFTVKEQNKNPGLPDWCTFGTMDNNSDMEVLLTGKPVQYNDSGYISGKFLYLDIRKAPIFNEKGEMIGLVGSGHDITSQKKAESDINKRDILLDAIAKASTLLMQGEDIDAKIPTILELLGRATDSGSVRIYRNYPDSHYSMPLLSLNFEWTDGLTLPRIEDKRLHMVPYEEFIPRWFNIFNSGNLVFGITSTFPENERGILETFGVKSILAAPIFVDNFFWGFIAFSHHSLDKEWLTSEGQILSTAANTIGFAFQRKYSRDELIKAKEKAEESDRLKSAFLANMSHEIRTPMNGILGFTELLKEPMLTGEEQQQYIRIIEKSGIRMLNIINDIISISTLEAGFIKANPSEVDINEQLDYIYNFFRPQIEEKGVRFIVNNSLSKGDSTICTDREKLYAILTNLTRNAVKFTSSGFIEVGCNKKEDCIEFYVKDTGIGILPEQKEVIFERFRQGNDSLTSGYEGAGLGLAISKAYTELLGGRIWVESEPGKGSTFFFTVPDHTQCQT